MKRNPLGSRDRKLKRGGSIIGVDEVGRGCLAGPVVVGAALVRRIPANPLVQDSKVLSPRQRKQAAEWLLQHLDSWTIVEVWPEIIDRINILEATRLAMRSAVLGMDRIDAAVVVDGVALDLPHAEVHSAHRADARYFSVAAASILAKVHRDRLMVELSRNLPFWAWENNKGYGSKQHRMGLQEHGQSFLHRRSFRWSPVLP